MSSVVMASSTTRTTWRFADTATVVAVYAATRLISAAFLLHAGQRQEGTRQFISNDPWNYYVFRPLPADPGYLGVATNWDGQWY